MSDIKRHALPPGFDPQKRSHIDQLAAMVAKKFGSDWTVRSIDTTANEVIATRAERISNFTTRESASGTIIEVGLSADAKPADAARDAAVFEAQNPGFTLTKYMPHLRKAEMRTMNEESIRCRDAIAEQLAVKPWEVQVKGDLDAGFEVILPTKYVPAKHDAKLLDVAHTFGTGWHVKTDALTLRSRFIPGEPPTFPSVIHYPMKQIGKGDWHSVPIGRRLPDPGQAIGPEMAVDWIGAGNLMVSGLPRAGKSVVINAIIAGSLATGVELVVIDTFDKAAADFLWCREFVRDRGWGCDSVRASIAALGLVFEEGKRRAAILREAGVQNWMELPEDKAFPPILVVIDEFTELTFLDRKPQGLKSDNPLMREWSQNAQNVAALQGYVNRIIAVMGFVGCRILLASQITNATAGISPSLKGKIGNRLLQGPKPSDAQRAQALNDPKSVPLVPENVQADTGAARGVGTAELAGDDPGVYKGYFAKPIDYRDALIALGVPMNNHRQEPTDADIDRLAPLLDDEDGDDGGSRIVGSQPEPFTPKRQTEEWMLDPVTGERLTGYEYANASRAAGKRMEKESAAAQAAQNPGADPDDAF